MTTTARDIIELLGLERHPEGGWYRETFRDDAREGRAKSTAIYFLLEAGEVSDWHRIDQAELWHWYSGAPLELNIDDGKRGWMLMLGNDLADGQRPQGLVPAGAWQRASSRGEWTLVGCTVAPGFAFEHFELAPTDFTPTS
jgi:predicted cupin superfamily sugar epimerase